MLTSLFCAVMKIVQEMHGAANELYLREKSGLTLLRDRGPIPAQYISTRNRFSFWRQLDLELFWVIFPARKLMRYINMVTERVKFLKTLYPDCPKEFYEEVVQAMYVEFVPVDKAALGCFIEIVIV